MSEKLLKTGSMRSDGTAYPLVSDINGFLSVTNSGLFVPRRDANFAANTLAVREAIHQKYVEAEYPIFDKTNALDLWSKGSDESTHGLIEKIKLHGDEYDGLRIRSTEGVFTAGKTFSADLSTYDSIRFTIDTEDADSITNFQLIFDAPNTSNRFVRSNSNENNVKGAIKTVFGKGTIAIEKSSFSATGDADWANVTRAYIALGTPTESHPLEVVISDFKFIKQKPKRAKFIMRIDDGLGSVYDVAEPIFRKYNVPASLFVNPGFVSTTERAQHVAYGGLPAMVLSELKELHAKGWSISGHTYYHNLYRDPTVSAAQNFVRYRYHQAYHDLTAVQDWLYDNGFGDGACASVYGNQYYNAETMAAALDVVPLEFSTHVKMTHYDPMPWGSSLRHISVENFVAKTNDRYVNIDSVIEDKGLCVVMMHRFDGDGIDGSISAQTLDDMLAYITSKDADIITVADLANATPVALR